jgi:hypothetical protein
MSGGIKRKPLPDELTAALRAGVQGVPPAVPAPHGRVGEGPKRRAPKTVQVNFNCTEDMARLIAQLAFEAGSTRRMFARLLRDAGHVVPGADLNPPDNRRRWQTQAHSPPID